MKRKYIIGLIGLIIVIAVIASQFFNKTDNGIEVEIVQIKRTDIVETVTATGKVQPEIEIKISPEVSGEIINLAVKEGQIVQKGQLLVEINPGIYESNVDRMAALLATSKAGLEQATAQLKEAKANHERNKTLFEKGVISGSEWDKVVSAYEVGKATQNSSYYNVESSKAALLEAQQNLLKTTIYSPADGTISRVDVELGERVLGTQQMAGTELLRVANLNSMEVEVDINENDVVKVKENDRVRIDVDAYPKKEFQGVVTSIANSASNTTASADQVTTFKVKIKILKSSYQDLLDGKLKDYSPFRPGMTAAVKIVTKEKKKVLTIPISAVVMRSESEVDKEKQNTEVKESLKEAVYINEGGVAKLRFIKTGIQDDTNIEVVSGLEENEEVITGPYSVVSRTLKQDDKIKREELKK